MINETQIYPSILKLSLITPTLKSDKDPLDLDSYRPINNLSTLDKIIEEYLKLHMQSYFDTNNIIGNNHHGSRKNHGTNTAITQIMYELTNNYEQNNYTALLQTDLSAAFDTVDTNKLIDKLNYYGVEGKELNLIKSFLTDRKQFVSIDTFNSQIIDSPACSVIQGSKLSALLYTIYINEVTDIHKIIGTELFSRLTMVKKTYIAKIGHVTVNYVDDSSSIINCKNIENLK